MDWTKAKNILIIALLITNAIIATTYAVKVHEKNKEWSAEAAYTKAYFEDIGVSIQTDIPSKPLKMAVLFVRFETSDAQEPAAPAYDGSILIESASSMVSIVPVRRGETKRLIASASYALLKYAAAAASNGEEPADIRDIELVYWVDYTEHDEKISEDTAIPAWKLSLSDDKVFYVNAYGE